MGHTQAGFSLVEAMITLILGTIMIFAFYDLYNQTVRISQTTLERAYAINMAARYLDQARFTDAQRYVIIDSDLNVAEGDPTPYYTQPEARGTYRRLSWVTTQAPGLQKANVSISYGPPNDRQTVTMSAFVRYSGGLYY
ncbi:prepilin-type N-terminal cleavage/methylation domain-containing protein [Candidatus Saccharibacteria bacterium]|nr:prepilin-type N-terminal cleavage/methylation domain-containing protein [Candidatus Saccharibacteria bacterium]